MAAVRRVLVGVHGSLGSLQALRYAAAEARRRAVPLVPVIAWLPPGGDLAERRQPSQYLRRMWTQAAWERLWSAFESGLGGIPGDIEVEPVVIRGDTGPSLVDVASGADDLLIVGTGRRGWFRRLLHVSAGRYCVAHAQCPVVVVPPSALVEEVSHGMRSWHLRRQAAHGIR